MIKMICGATRVGNEIKRAGDDPFSLSPDEEKRLVKRGVAVYVDETSVSYVATPPGGDFVPPPSCDTTDGGGGPAGAEGAPGEDDGNTMLMAFGDNGLKVVSGHLVPEDLMQMTKGNMVKLAADMGVDIKDCKNKADIAAALAEVEIQVEESDTKGDEDDGEAPPDLAPGGPV